MDADVDVRDPDEKSIMTYVAQFLQYSKELPVAEEDVQVCHKPSFDSPGNVCSDGACCADAMHLDSFFTVEVCLFFWFFWFFWS